MKISPAKIIIGIILIAFVVQVSFAVWMAVFWTPDDPPTEITPTTSPVEKVHQ